METRNLVLSLVVATAAFLLYMQLVNRFAPRSPAPPPPVVAATQPTPIASVEAEPEAAAAPMNETADRRPSELRASPVRFSEGDQVEPIPLGGLQQATEGYPLHVTFEPRGAGVSTIQLTTRNAKGEFVHRPTADSKQPYTLIAPIGESEMFALQTNRVWVAELDNKEFELADLIWNVAEQTADSITFETTLRDAGRSDAGQSSDATGGTRTSGVPLVRATHVDGTDDNAIRSDGAQPDGNNLLRITKRYALSKDAPLIWLTYDVQNLSRRPLTVTLAQDAALGITHADRMYDLRKSMVAERSADGIEMAWKDRGGLTSNPTLLAAGKQFAWAATMDRYFGVFLRSLPPTGSTSLYTDVISSVGGTTALSGPPDPHGPSDMLLRLFTKGQKLEAGQRWQPGFEIYAGPKDPDALKKVNVAYVQPDQLDYNLAQVADESCFCSFHWLTVLMTGLLRGIYTIVRNYGVAIIVLVIVVRTLLHPLAVFQQRSMYRMQESMGRLQPKMQAIKEKFASDRVKQNQETMRLMAEEGVNPAGNFVAFLPMFLQMPILIALWQALSTDIELRLAPFDGWWIRDLSAPDALIKFASGFTLPILGWLPLIGPWFSNIPSLNVLPILMGIAMWLQQKYTPKPKIERPANAPPPKPGSMTPEEQQRQQQMIANMMAVMLPIMFYNFPSGLCLYWLATNVFGIFESIRIRKQIARDKARRAAMPADTKKTPRPPGFMGRLMKRMAEQAEDIQRKADELSREKTGGKKQPK